MDTFTLLRHPSMKWPWVVLLMGFPSFFAVGRSLDPVGTLVPRLSQRSIQATDGNVAPAGFSIVDVAGDFDLPTAFAYAPDGRILVTEKSGAVQVVDSTGAYLGEFLDVRDQTNEYGDRGLLGIALDPEFDANDRVYLLWTEELNPEVPDSDLPAGGKLVRVDARADDPNVADTSTMVTLVSGFDSNHYSHSVGALRFDDAGRLLASFGDGASYEAVDARALNTYDLTSLSGKIIRIDPESGAGVPENPYFDPTAPSSNQSRVLARGFRNTLRFSFHPETGDIYGGDVGWSTWEEINRIPGLWTDPELELNFGWPCYEGITGESEPQPGYQYDSATAETCTQLYTPEQGGTGIGAAPPIYAYNHADPGGESGSSVTGGVVYLGDAYPSTYHGRYFFADYARNRFQTLAEDGTVEDFGTRGGWGNPVDIQIAPDGNIAYIAIGYGSLRKIVYSGDNQSPTAVAAASPTSARRAPARIRFSSAGSSDPDGDALYYLWEFGDGRSSPQASPYHTYRAAGTYYAKLTVSDQLQGGLSDSAMVTVNVGNQAPTVEFLSPTEGMFYAVGDMIAIELDAKDKEDGDLSGDSVTWRVLLYHLGHTHYQTSGEGESGAFEVLDHGDDTYLAIEATARDALGGETTASVTLEPLKVAVSLYGSPSGVSIAVDSTSQLTPYSWNSIVGSRHTISAPASQTLDGMSYEFDHWSNSLDTTLELVVPTEGYASTAYYEPAP